MDDRSKPRRVTVLVEHYWPGVTAEAFRIAAERVHLSALKPAGPLGWLAMEESTVAAGGIPVEENAPYRPAGFSRYLTWVSRLPLHGWWVYPGLVLRMPCDHAIPAGAAPAAAAIGDLSLSFVRRRTAPTGFVIRLTVTTHLLAQRRGA